VFWKRNDVFWKRNDVFWKRIDVFWKRIDVFWKPVWVRANPTVKPLPRPPQAKAMAQVPDLRGPAPTLEVGQTVRLYVHSFDSEDCLGNYGCAHPNRDKQAYRRLRGGLFNKRGQCVVFLHCLDERGRTYTVHVGGYRPYLLVQAPQRLHEDIVDQLNELCGTAARGMDLLGGDDLADEDTKFVGVSQRLKPSRGWHYDPATPGQRGTVPVLRVEAPSTQLARTAAKILAGKDNYDRELLLEQGLKLQPTHTVNTFPPAQQFSSDQHVYIGHWVDVQVARVCDATHRVSFDQVEFRTTVAGVTPVSFEDCSVIPPHLKVIMDGEMVCGDKATVLAMDEHTRRSTFPNALRAGNEVVMIALRVQLGRGDPWTLLLTTASHADTRDLWAGAEAAHRRVMRYETELAMLRAYRDITVEQLNADIISGYNSDEFDHAYIVRRLAVLLGRENLEAGKKAVRDSRWLHWGRMMHYSAGYDKWGPHRHRCSHKACPNKDDYRSRYCKCTFVDCACDPDEQQWAIPMPGRVSLDLYKYWKFAQKMKLHQCTWKLDAVARRLLKHAGGDDTLKGKLDVPGHEIARMWHLGGATRRQLLLYCEQDVDLVLRLINYKNVLEGIVAFCRTCNTPMVDIVKGGEKVKSRNRDLMRMCQRGTFHNPTAFPMIPNIPYVGGKVVTPDPQVTERPVPAVDFASLYPTTQRAENYCYRCVLRCLGVCVLRMPGPRLPTTPSRAPRAARSCVPSAGTRCRCPSSRSRRPWRPSRTRMGAWSCGRCTPSRSSARRGTTRTS